MRIKHVELVGFKSFVDKTRLTFHEGISGIVGPNGCGKSNVVDALRWVMGELSAKSLRGTEMQDVIFAGSETRKPTSLAQVSLVFSCDDGVFPAGYDGFSEVEIARCLYRSGESGYFINRIPCRLKDIQELLMDTGIGSRTYAVIEQGQIAKVLSAKPVERRFLIEEAAGVTKYRVRREETERKIESTKQNLERVEDLVGEIRRNVGSLARQAGRARRYKEYTDELRAIDLELTARESAELSRKEEEAQRFLRGLKEKIEAEQGRIAAEEAAGEARRLEHLRASKALEKKQEALAKMQEDLHRSESARAVLRQEIAEEQARVQALEQESLAAAEAVPGHEAAAEEALAQAREAAVSIDSQQARLEDLKTRLEIYRKTRKENTEAADGFRARIHDATRKIAVLAGKVEGHEERKSRSDEILARLAARREDLARKSEDAHRKAGELTEAAKALREEAAALEAGESEAAAELDRRKLELAERKSALEALRSDFQSAKVRLESLSQMKEKLEGCSDGVRRIMAGREGDAAAVAGVLGLLGDVLEVGEEHERALQAVLGERVEAVLFENQENCLQAADFLRAEGGRSTFIPMQMRPARAVYPEETLSQTRGPLLGFVRCPERYEGVVAALLDNVLLVDSLESAIRLHNANGYTGAFVTPAGEFVDSYGVITGGSGRDLQHGIMANNRLIRELSESLESLRVRLDEAEGGYRGIAAAVASGEKDLQSVRGRLASLNKEVSEREGELRRAAGDAEANAEQLRLVDEEAERTAGDLAALEAETRQARIEAARLEEEMRLLRADLQLREDALYEGSRNLDGLQSEVTQVTADLAGLRERRKAALDRETTARWTLQKIREDLDRRSAAVGKSRAKVAAGEERVAEIERALSEKVVEVVEFKKDLDAARRALEESEEQISAADARLRVMRRDLDGMREELSRLEVGFVELRMKRDHIAGRLADRYGLTLEQIPPECGKDDSIDPQVLSERRRELQGKIERIGPVNVEAIEEYANESKRLDFFVAQKTDLVEAIAALERAIAKINRESRERFIKAFHEVAAKFAEVLPKLFGGGAAKMEMTEPDNPLESGIEISIQPPGKKLTNINLLSGGEKAMGSIGLIFSIFLIKPSPFCLLDEVDAPLDDANIERFNELMALVRKYSQVILITHNKRTMRIAETLYGVTMQEPGVSTLVSVRFSDTDEIVREASEEKPALMQ